MEDWVHPNGTAGRLVPYLKLHPRSSLSLSLSAPSLLSAGVLEGNTIRRGRTPDRPRLWRLVTGHLALSYSSVSLSGSLLAGLNSVAAIGEYYTPDWTLIIPAAKGPGGMKRVVLPMCVSHFTGFLANSSREERENRCVPNKNKTWGTLRPDKRCGIGCSKIAPQRPPSEEWRRIIFHSSLRRY